MQHLDRDSRGYPIPTIVYRDGTGKPQNAVVPEMRCHDEFAVHRMTTAHQHAEALVRAAAGPLPRFGESPLGRRLFRAAVKQFRIAGPAVDERQQAAILTGLALLRYHHAAITRQRHNELDSERKQRWRSLFTKGGALRPLSVAEIDALIERITKEEEPSG